MPQKMQPIFLNSLKMNEINNFSESNITLNNTRGLNSLNPQQLKVVKEAEGPCLVLAGAGTGKTKVLVHRLAYILEKGIKPYNIFLATFTNKAAELMRQRAQILTRSPLTGLWTGTFHHLGNIILHREAEKIGYRNNFSIIDTSDSKDCLSECLKTFTWIKKEKSFPKPELIFSIFNLCANSLISIEEVIANSYPHLREYTAYLKKIHSLYQEKKKQLNVMDFSDLLVNWLKLLKENRDVQEKYSRQFKYILVDEYQDTNKIQFQILQELSRVHNNILVVGDDAQSIYSFRGARIDNILEFPRTFKGTKIFKLEINYRSHSGILFLANEVISHNKKQFPKKLTPTKENFNFPKIVKVDDVYAQAKFVIEKIKKLTFQENIPLREIAILFRARFQALELEVELAKENIPYIIRGGIRFFEQAHIKDVVSYLRFLVNREDELSFKRAISLHKGISKNYAHKIWLAVKKNNYSLKNISLKLPSNPKQGWENFKQLLSSLEEIKNPTLAIRKILEQYRDYCYLSFANPQERIDDIEEMAKMAKEYSSLENFLLKINSYEEFKTKNAPFRREINTPSLVLSTIHQAKGLEWEVVFLVGFSDYEFPNPRSLESEERLEEERRLLYVAITRTKNILYITYPQNKYTFKNGIIKVRPSLFYYEISPDCYEEIDMVIGA